MNPLLPVVLGIAAPGIWGCEEIPRGSSELISDRDWCPIEMDLEGIDAKTELMGLLAEAGRFPAYFGSNWDATADCLEDLSWLECGGYVVLVRNGSSLSDCCPDATAILLDVLAEASETWNERGVVFTTVWEGRLPNGFPELDQL